MKKKKEKARGLVYILLEIMGKTAETLMEEEAYVELSQDKKDEIWMECLFFNLHQFNRTFFVWIGRHERDELMDAALIELNKYMKIVIEEGEKKAYDNLSTDSFEHYVEISSFQNWLEDFNNIYNKREEEYAQYNDNLKEGEGLAGTLLWEFGNKVARMMDREKDIEIIMKMQFIGTAFTYFADALKELIETGKIGDADFKLDGEK
ncbi:MAG: hypothetical protein ABH844_01520 [Candidatus Omnitrophota bacterium]